MGPNILSMAPGFKDSSLYYTLGAVLLKIATPVLINYAYTIEVEGSDQYPAHFFKKPIFILGSLAVGSLLSIIVHVIVSKVKKITVDTEVRTIVEFESERMEKLSKWKYYVYMAIPVIIESISFLMRLLALTNLSLVYWQLLGGASYLMKVIFKDLFCMKLSDTNTWIGSALAFVGSVLAIASAFIFKNEEISTKDLIIGTALTIGGHLLEGVSAATEKVLLKGRTGVPTLRLALRGIWTFMFVSCIVIPATSRNGYQGATGYRFGEDHVDSLNMFGNSVALLVTIPILIFVYLGANVFGELSKEAVSGLMNLIITSGEVIGVWIVQVILFYATDSTRTGEKWNSTFYIYFLSLAFIIFGQLMVEKVLFGEPKAEENTKDVDDL